MTGREGAGAPEAHTAAGRPLGTALTGDRLEDCVTAYVPFPAYFLGTPFPQIKKKKKKKSHLLGSKIKHIYGT